MKSQLLLFKKSYHLSEIAKKLEAASNKTLFVVNANKVLFGAISDGDIRRAILKSSSLIFNINDIMSQEPYFIYNNTAIEHTNFLFENFLYLKNIQILYSNNFSVIFPTLPECHLKNRYMNLQSYFQLNIV